MMKVYIYFLGSGISPEDSLELDQLRQMLIEDCEVNIQTNKSFQKIGSKSELTTGLEIAGLALSSISTLVSVLGYWRSRTPKYSIAISRSNVQQKIDNLSSVDLNDFIEQLKSVDNTADIGITISEQ